MENLNRYFIIGICFSVPGVFTDIKTVNAHAPERCTDTYLISEEGILNAAFEFDSELENKDLLDFKASYNGNSTVIEWRTEKTSEISLFILEVSEDGENFKSLNEIKAYKKGQDLKSYHFIDNDHLLKDSYYRLEIITSEGHKSYSSVVMVKVNPLNQLRLFPIPVKTILNIKGYFGAFDEIDIKISDMNGTSFPVLNLVKISDGHYTIDFSSLKSNTYFVKISSNGKSASYRVLKL